MIGRTAAQVKQIVEGGRGAGLATNGGGLGMAMAGGLTHGRRGCEELAMVDTGHVVSPGLVV